MRRRSDMTFPPEEYERRLSELRERMAARELDAVIITDPEILNDKGISLIGRPISEVKTYKPEP